MPLLDRLFPRQASAAEIERVSQQLHRASAAPTLKTLSCLCESPRPAAVTDWMHWSIWQDKQNRQVWVHCSGGVAGVDVWYGPGDPSVAAALGAA
jgi:hypothetical protein